MDIKGTEVNKLPPHDIDAEENVIGSLLIDGDMISGLDIAPTDFYAEKTGLCFKACQSLKERGVSINPVTLSRELKDSGYIETVGGPAYLSYLISICATSIDCPFYADIVKRLSIYRQIIAASNRIAELGYSGGHDAGAILEKADDILLALRKHNSASPILTPNERADLMLERYNDLNNIENGVALSSGLRDLDYWIGGGFHNGELTIMGARPGMGKTTLATDIARSAGKQGRKVLFCSAEMTADSITDRDIAAATGLPTNTIRRGGYDEKTFKSIIDALPVVAASNIYVQHTKEYTTSKILQQGLNMKLRYGLDLIIVDYLQLLNDDFGNTAYERVSHISRRLKSIAVELDVPLIAACQLNRAVEARQDKRPMLYDLRESGRIEEDADLVLFIHRDNYYDRDTLDKSTDLIIAKQRQGEANKIVGVYYDSTKQRYCDIHKGGN